MHYFDFEYRDKLASPWYSGLAQGLGLSLLSRAYIETRNDKYLNAAKRAWISMELKTNAGGVIFEDKKKIFGLRSILFTPDAYSQWFYLGLIWSI